MEVVSVVLCVPYFTFGFVPLSISPVSNYRKQPILLLDLFHFQFLLYQTIGNSLQIPVITISFLAQSFNGLLVTPDVEYVIQPKDGLCVTTTHERMTRNFKASSAYWRLDFPSSMLPQMERLHTTPMPTKREKTLLDLMSKQWR